MKIAYICDGLASCSDKVGCYRLAKPGMDFCNHTFDPKHAKYGVCEHPEDYPERFHEVFGDEENIKYWEGTFIINNVEGENIGS